MRPVEAVVVAVALAAVGSSCAGADHKAPSAGHSGQAFEQLSGRQVAERTAAALKKVSSVHLEGSGRYQNDRATMDLSVDKAGTCVGRFEVRGARFDVIHAPDRRWLFRGNAKYWSQFGPRRHRDDAVTRFAGHWVDVSAGELSAALEKTCKLDLLWQQIIPQDVEGCVRGAGGPATDEPTVQVMCDDTRVWVQARAPHRPVQYDGPQGAEIESVTLRDYDRPVRPEVPPDDEIVNPAASESV